MLDNRWVARFGRLGQSVGTIVVLLGLLLGCAQSEPTPTPEPAKIMFAIARAQRSYYEEIAQEFAKSHPELSIQVVDSRVDDADVFQVSPFELRDHIEGGEILSLDAFNEQQGGLDLSDFYPGTVDLFRSDGKLWAIPAGADTVVMFYNEDLLERYNAPRPRVGWTWNDFLATSTAMRDPNEGIFGYAPMPDTYDALLYVIQNGGQIFDDLNNPTRTMLDDPTTIDAVDNYVKLATDLNVMPTADEATRLLGRGGSRAYEAILGGRIGMWMGMISQRTLVQASVRFVPWGIVTLPRGTQSGTAAMVEGYAINPQTLYPELCWEWLIFLTQQPPMGLTPARRSVASSAAFEQSAGREVAEVARASMDDAVLITPALAGFDGAVEAFVAGVQMVMEGEATAEEAMIWAQRRAEGLP